MPIEDALDVLTAFLGNRLVRSKAELEAHGRSESHFPLTLPDAVAFPESTQEVSEILRICNAAGCPVIGWGAGTSLEGHGLAARGGLVVDFRDMNRVLAIDAQDMTATVEAGVTREALNDELRATGLFFPVDPGANATIGGMAATRASGTTAVRYGTMRHNVLATRAVLADGRVITTGARAPKSSAGYDLTGLLVGSEGTLGLMTEITLRLHGQPEATSAAVCPFADIHAAVTAVIETIQMGVPMARIEFVDAATARAFNGYAGANMREMPHLMVEFHGSERGVAEDAERFGEIAAEHGGLGFEWSARTEDRSRLWTMRHNAHYACLATRPGARAIVTDICVPISKLAEAIEETAADIDASPIAGPILGHVGDGNFHAILLMDENDPAEVAAAKALSQRMVERALRLGGTMSGEHGVGMGKLDYMEAEHGPGWAVMGEIKKALDPGNILNPGKMVKVN